MKSTRQNDVRREDESPWRRFLSADIIPRILVILLIVPLLFYTALQGGLLFRLMIGLIILLGLREFIALTRAKGYEPSGVLIVIAGLACAWAGVNGGAHIPLIITATILTAMILELARKDSGHPLVHISITLLGVLYVGWLGSYVVQLREIPSPAGMDYSVGLRALGLAAAITWTCDTAAYLVGVAFGSRPLMKRVSPKKSLEGAIGGTLGATAVGVVASLTFVPFISPVEGALIGLVGAIVAQAGDLVESLLKRDAGVKDTAGLLPGHGGVLDRIDSFLFTAPFVYFVIINLLHRGG